MIQRFASSLITFVILALAAVAHSDDADPTVQGGGTYNLCPTPPVIIDSISSNDTTQSGRLIYNDVISSCGILNKVCPGVTDVANIYRHKEYSFNNNTGQGRCVTITVEPTSCAGQVFSAVYGADFFPNSLCGNYVGDQGAPSGNQGVSYSFNTSPGQTFRVVVTESMPGGGCASYKLFVNAESCSGFPQYEFKSSDNFNDFDFLGGWSQLGTTTAQQGTTFSAANTSLLAQIKADALNWRVIGWITNSDHTYPYQGVSTYRFLRGKFFVYATGQSGSALNEIPNFRMRLANRFAVTAQLVVNNHLNADPEATALGQDIRPSDSPTTPSIYRVDMDPIDVPHLLNNPNTEGFLSAFEAYEPNPQANGVVALAQRDLGVYPKLEDYALVTAISPGQNGLLKRYVTSPTDGGDFGTGNIGSSNSSAVTAKYHNGVLEAVGPQPDITVTSAGVTIQTLNVESDRLGLAAFDVFNDTVDQSNHLTRARFERGKQYKFRFHATSTQISNEQSLIRFRARTLKFMYTAALEIGGATGASVNSNTIAAQALPGIGNQIPDSDRLNPGENGGWYNILMVSPLDSSIQASQPNLLAQDGPGTDTQPLNNSKSRRDLQFGFDVIDTFSTNPTSGLERGHMTVDQVEIMAYKLMPD